MVTGKGELPYAGAVSATRGVEGDNTIAVDVVSPVRLLLVVVVPGVHTRREYKPSTVISVATILMLISLVTVSVLSTRESIQNIYGMGFNARG